MAGEVLDWPASPETIDFPLDFLDFPCFSIGSARGPEMWEPIGGLPHIFVGPQKKYLSAIRVSEGFFQIWNNCIQNQSFKRSKKPYTSRKLLKFFFEISPPARLAPAGPEPAEPLPSSPGARIWMVLSEIQRTSEGCIKEMKKSRRVV